MSLLSKLEYKKGFSDIEKGIANYIIDHKEEVANMRLVELAEATFTSTATISRFCKKLGEKNYNSFKINFASSVLTSYQTDVDYNRPFKENDSIQEVTNQLGELYKDTIEATKALLDYDVLNQVIEKLLKTSVIDIFAVGASYLSGLLFEHRMISIDHFVNFKSSPNDQDKRSLFINKNTVAIVISYSGESHEIKTIVDRIVDNKGTIIAITSINDSYLRKRANYCLTMCSKENIVSKIETYSSKLSSDYLMDLIFSILFQKDYYPNLIRKINCEQKYEKKTDHDM